MLLKMKNRRCLAVALCLLTVACWLGKAVQAQERQAPLDLSSAQSPPADNASMSVTNPLKLFSDGGVLMYPILICSIVSMVFTFERTISLRRGRIVPGPFVKRFLHQLSEGQLTRDQALQLCEDNASPVATVFAAAARRWGKPCVEVEQSVIDAGERAVYELRKNLRVFNAVATVCPLLGLLGTVFGIIDAFNAIGASHGAGRAELLASGIGEALITTAFGLIVAIPAMLFYWYFVSCVDRRTMEIDALSQQVVSFVAGDVPSESGGLKAARRVRRDAPVEAAR